MSNSTNAPIMVIKSHIRNVFSPSSEVILYQLSPTQDSFASFTNSFSPMLTSAHCRVYSVNCNKNFVTFTRMDRTPHCRFYLFRIAARSAPFGIVICRLLPTTENSILIELTQAGEKNVKKITKINISSCNRAELLGKSVCARG